MFKIQKNVSLAKYTTFRIGGPAKYFSIIKNKDDLIKTVDFAKSKDLPYFILGGGSNLLVSDNGFEGLVIKIQNSKIKIQNENSKFKIIYVEAGARLSDLVKFSIEHSSTGLEWAIGIPGTIGGAVQVKAKAFGSDISQSVKEINKIDQIIFSVVLELEKGNREKSKQLIKEYIQKRKETQPLEYASAGCVFKNPPGQSAGRLIDQAGLKGTKIGQAMISDKHANFIINLGQAQAQDVIQLINLIKQTIKEKYQIELEEEINRLGF
ncbi:MAG: UDP-N-acetylmuramate dehydrogenase [Patescibacteria group bacterium]